MAIYSISFVYNMKYTNLSNLGPVIGTTIYKTGGFMGPFVAMGSMNLVVSISIVFTLRRISCSYTPRKDKDSKQGNISIACAVKV